MINLAHQISYDPANYSNIQQKTSIPIDKLFYLNIEQFEYLNKITGNAEASLLFSKLKFFWNKYSFLHKGERKIITNIDKIADWFGFCRQKTSSLLALLKDVGLIGIELGLMHGIKSLFIAINKKINFVPMNHKLMDLLRSRNGTVTEALILLRIVFGYMNTKIEKFGKKWCSLTHKELADFTKVSSKTIARAIDKILKRGVVSLKVFRRDGIPQSHFHIPEDSLNDIRRCIAENGWIEGKWPVNNYSEHDEMSTSETDKIEQSEMDKNALSIRIEIITENNIINSSKNVVVFPTSVNEEKVRDVNFYEQNERRPASGLVSSSKNIININNYIRCEAMTPIIRVDISDEDVNFSEKELSHTQKSIVEKAFEGLKKGGLRFSNPKEVLEQMIFSIVNKEQHHGILTFTHRLNRILKLLGAKIWSTPKGFAKHCPFGVEQKRKKDIAEKSWEAEKRSEYQIPMASNEIDSVSEKRKKTTQSHPSLNSAYKLNIANNPQVLTCPTPCSRSLNSEAKTSQGFYSSSGPDNKPMSDKQKHDGLKQVRNLRDIIRCSATTVSTPKVRNSY